MMANDSILRPEDMCHYPESTVHPEASPESAEAVTGAIRSLVEDIYTVE